MISFRSNRDAIVRLFVDSEIWYRLSAWYLQCEGIAIYSYFCCILESFYIYYYFPGTKIVAFKVFGGEFSSKFFSNLFLLPTKNTWQLVATYVSMGGGFSEDASQTASKVINVRVYDTAVWQPVILYGKIYLASDV